MAKEVGYRIEGMKEGFYPTIGCSIFAYPTHWFSAGTACCSRVFHTSNQAWGIWWCVIYLWVSCICISLILLVFTAKPSAIELFIHSCRSQNSVDNCASLQWFQLILCDYQSHICMQIWSFHWSDWLKMTSTSNCTHARSIGTAVITLMLESLLMYLVFL